MKQYLLIFDENTKDFFESVCPKLQFLEIQGMTMNGNTHNVLVTPILAPVNPMPVPEPTQLPPPPEEPSDHVDER